MSALVMGGLGIKTADAQLGIHVNLRFGTPVYAPAPVVVNEPVYDDYYYLPEAEAYYSVGEHCYYYQDGDRWISATYLPGRYRNFDWRTARRYEIHANRPFMHHDVYRGRFGGGMNRDDVYARGGYSNRDFNNGRDRGHEQQYDNRGGFDRRDNNRGGYDRRDDRSQGGYNQNQGGYNQPSQGGYNQQNPGRNQGGYNGGSQPSQDQGQRGGNRGNNQDGSSQPTNHNGGQNRGGNVSEHFAASNMGVVQERPAFARPVRN
jgi:hypothetical protein